MKTNFLKLVSGIAVAAGILFAAESCQKNSGKYENSRVQIRLTDAPDPNVKEVWVDIREVWLKLGDSNEVKLTGAYPGAYNLLELTNGKDTVLADAEIPAGTISQIRLVLGDNNYIITKTGEKIFLTTPSAQQSGLKVQLHQSVSGGLLYRLVLDFDAGKSIVKAGNSGNYLLKPVLRLISFTPSGGIVKGVVMPDSVLTTVFAIKGTDTIASTFTARPGGQYLFWDIPAGVYNFSFIPNDTIHKETVRAATVVLGQTTIIDTVKLEKK